MKKLVSIVLSVAMVATLGFSAFAATKATAGSQESKVMYKVGEGGFMWSVPDTVDFNAGTVNTDTGLVSQSATIDIKPLSPDLVLKVNNGSVFKIHVKSENAFLLKNASTTETLSYKFLNDQGAELADDSDILTYSRSDADPAGTTMNVGFTAKIDDIQGLKAPGAYSDKLNFSLTYAPGASA